MIALKVLSGGAAEGLAGALAPDLARSAGVTMSGTFGAVGAMREKLLAGAAADIVILTRALVTGLERDGHVKPGSTRDVGVVRTAIAVRRGDPLPLVGTPALLRDALLVADEIHVPDMQQSTAGQHVAKVMHALGIAGTLTGRMREHPNGMTAMRELARSTAARPIGCTQVTEIVSSTGVTLVRLLPKEHELATVYTAAITTRVVDADAARRAIEVLTGGGSAALRARAGFEAV